MTRNAPLPSAAWTKDHVAKTERKHKDRKITEFDPIVVGELKAYAQMLIVTTERVEEVERELRELKANGR
jgi:hypothetical protein